MVFGSLAWLGQKRVGMVKPRRNQGRRGLDTKSLESLHLCFLGVNQDINKLKCPLMLLM